MAERGVVFPAWKVLALLAGKLTLDVRPRRVEVGRGREEGYLREVGAFGTPGDTLWVCETWALMWSCDTCDEAGAGVEYGWPDGDRCTHCRLLPVFKADDPRALEDVTTWEGEAVHWRRPRTMPREHARLFLEVVAVRVARIGDLTQAEAAATGVEPFSSMAEAFGETGHRLALAARWDEGFSAGPRFVHQAAEELSWGFNPWAVLTEVRRCEAPVVASR